MVAVLAHFWNGNVIVQADAGVLLEPLVALFRQVSQRSVAGVFGPLMIADQVISDLGLKQQNFNLYSKQDLYSLNLNALVIPVTEQGRLVNANEIEPTLLARWMNAYSVEALGKTDDAALAANMIKWARGLNSDSDYWVYLYNDQPVCMSGFNARLPDTVQVGPVLHRLNLEAAVLLERW